VIRNDIYRRIRYRLDDPLRDLHVPKRERVDTDEDEWADDAPEKEPTEDVDLDSQPAGEIVPEEDLV